MKLRQVIARGVARAERTVGIQRNLNAVVEHVGHEARVARMTLRDEATAIPRKLGGGLDRLRATRAGRDEGSSEATSVGEVAAQLPAGASTDPVTAEVVAAGTPAAWTVDDVGGLVDVIGSWRANGAEVAACWHERDGVLTVRGRVGDQPPWMWGDYVAAESAGGLMASGAVRHLVLDHRDEWALMPPVEVSFALLDHLLEDLATDPTAVVALLAPVAAPVVLDVTEAGSDRAEIAAGG